MNPFGVLYNPPSIQKVLRYALGNESPPPQTFLQNGGVHLNYDFHSELSTLEEHELPMRINTIISSTHQFLLKTNWLIITLGTAWVYERRDTGEVVANCHKLPSVSFSKRLLQEQEIVNSFEAFYKELIIRNPEIKIILTVSPVRHLKETLELNSVSKSILRTACFQLTKSYLGVDYFPAYEIMIDELRDYRFYKADLIHPSAVAEDHIWEKFGHRYFTPELQKFIQHCAPIERALKHRSFHPSSLGHQQFLKETLKKLEELKSMVNVDVEINALKSQLVSNT